jgi:hypothetical protein
LGVYWEFIMTDLWGWGWGEERESSIHGHGEEVGYDRSAIETSASPGVVPMTARCPSNEARASPGERLLYNSSEAVEMSASILREIWAMRHGIHNRHCGLRCAYLRMHRPKP